VDLSFTNDQLMVRNMAKEFATKELEPKAAEIDEKGEFPHDAIKKMAELGMLSMTIPEKYGGAAFDFLSLAIAIEEISRACGSTGVITAVHNSLACWPIVNWGTDAQKEKYLPRMATGPNPTPAPTRRRWKPRPCSRATSTS
jgi:alkylation response protein AidB-like acyl-CoA dehydrogenase